MLTLKQKIQRKNFICGSDTPVILGCNPWRTARDLYLDKRNPNVEEDKPSLPMECGNALEPLVLSKMKEKLDLHSISKSPGFITSIEYPFLGGTPDAFGNMEMLVENNAKPKLGKVLLEAKTVNAFKAKEWDTGVPEHVKIQVLHYLIVTNLRFGFVGVLIGNNDFRFYEVDAAHNETLIKEIIKKTKHFWEENVLKGIPPTVLLKKEEPREGEMVMNTFEDLALIDDIRKIREQCEDLRTQKEEKEKELQARMGKNKKVVVDGKTVAQYFAVTRKTLDKKAFEEGDKEAFEISKKYEVEKTTNSFRIERAK